MRSLFKLVLIVPIFVGILIIPAFPKETMAEQSPYFQLTLMASNDPVVGFEEFLLAQRIAGQLERLGIDIRVVNADDLLERMHPQGNNPNVVPGPYEQVGYDLAIFRTAFESFKDLWEKVHIWQSWDSKSTRAGVISPQLHDAQLNQDLEAMLGVHPTIPVQEALERVLYRLTWEFQPLIPLYETWYARYFHVAALQGLAGIGGVQTELRWGHNGIEAWHYAAESNQSTVRLSVDPPALTVFLPYNRDPDFYEYPPGAVLNGLLAPQGPRRHGDIAPAAFVPDLAQNLPVPVAGTSLLDGQEYRAEDRRIWELTIRSGIPWQPGYGYPAMPFTVEDVLFTFQSWWNDSRWGSRLAWLLGEDPLKGLEAVNNTTLRFYLTELEAPAPPDGMLKLEWFFDRLIWPILPRHILDPTYVSSAGAGKTADGAPIWSLAEWAQSDFNLGYRTNNYTDPAVIGTGPYRWEGPNGAPAYTQDSENLTVSRYDGYFKDNATLRLPTDVSTPQRPQFVSFQIFRNRSTALDRLLNGTIDVLWDWNLWYTIHSSAGFEIRDKAARQTLLDDPRFNASFRGSAIQCLYVNTAHNRLTRPVRLAIAHALNRDQLAEEMAQVEEFPLDGATANSLPLLLSHPAYPHALSTPPYDLETAWDYMEEAGYDMSPYRSEVTSQVQDSSGIVFGWLGLTAGILALAVRRFYGKET